MASSSSAPPSNLPQENMASSSSAASSHSPRATKSEITEIEMVREVDSSTTARQNVKTSITEVERRQKMPSTSTAVPESSELARARRNTMYYKFKQQELPSHGSILTPRLIILIFLLIGVVFIPIGVSILMASRNVVEIVYGYESECLPSNVTSNVTSKVAYIQNPTTDKTCNITLNVTKHMKEPVFVYYQLDKFYQNHNRYVKSRNDKQLRNFKDKNSVDDCKPENFVNDNPIVPCGLIAWSMFNDTYTFSINGKNLMVNKSGISWKRDRGHKFGKDVYPKNFQNSSIIGGAHLDESIPLSEQEDLMVWMNTAALPTFRKLYGRIEEDLKAGDMINVTIQNQYNTYSFNGKKKLVLSTTSWMGGKNDLLGIGYVTVGGLSLCMTLFLIIVDYFVSPRKRRDPSDWPVNMNQARAA